MARIAVIDINSNKVINVAESEEIPPSGSNLLFMESLTANIGDNFDGYNITSPTIIASNISTLNEAEEILAEHRRKRESGGININGINVKTTETSLIKINGAVSRAILEKNDSNSHKFYAEDGSEYPLTNAQFKSIGLALANHMQKCLDAANVVEQDIGSYTTAEQVQDAFDEAYNA